MFNMADQNLMIQKMRDELTNHGFTELRSPAEVDQALAQRDGTTLLMINSVCGCAAGSARPGVVMSLSAEPRPQRLLTVFAGQDREATDQARSYLTSVPPSSPSAALLKDGELVFFLPRHEIEGCTAEQVAAKLRTAYEKVLAG
jgi:putative YphP/YqiW family bacilliredoxin